MTRFRLAERLGMTVGELQARMTPTELALWPLVDRAEKLLAKRRKI